MFKWERARQVNGPKHPYQTGTPLPIFIVRLGPAHDRRITMIALLIQAALAAQCTPADYFCNLGRAPTYSEQEAGRMAAQRLQAERELIDRQAAATRIASDSQAEAARVLPHRIDGLIADGRCDAAADAALVGGDAGLAQLVRTRCKR